MDRRVLIFGVGGFVGAYLASEFRQRGYVVFGSDVKLGNFSDNLIGFYTCDLLDSGAVKRIISDVQPTDIVNLAAISSVGLCWKIPQKAIEVNVCGSLNILEAVRNCNPMPKVLLIGSSEEYAFTEDAINEQSELNANNPYGISKITQEKFSSIYRERYGMKIYHVRPFNHTGIGQADTFVIPSWCKQAAEISASGKPGVMRVGNLNVKRDFSNVKDIVRAYRMVLESEDCEAIYNIGSGTAVSLTNILNYIVSLSNQPISVEIDSTLFRPADNPIICCDHSLITKNLGWKPEFGIFDTVKELYSYFCELKRAENGMCY